MQKQRRRCGYSVVLVVSIILTMNSIGEAQQQPSNPMSISQAVESALRDYPSISVSQEQVNAAAAGIDLARTAYLPRVDSLAQVNRATRNNVFGLLFPQGVIPSISGPVLGSNNSSSVWGSAIGGLVSWEPFDFGLRRALESETHPPSHRHLRRVPPILESHAGTLCTGPLQPFAGSRTAPAGRG